VLKLCGAIAHAGRGLFWPPTTMLPTPSAGEDLGSLKTRFVKNRVCGSESDTMTYSSRFPVTNTSDRIPMRSTK
jgi:hypothetical protein